MAPAATTTPGVSWEAKGFKAVDKTKTIRVQEDGLKYPEYYPYNDPNDKFPDPEPFDYHERALDADPSLPVFYNDHVTVEEITPFIGVKVTGLDLASLDKAGQDQLALLAARKGIVFFASNDNVKQTYRDTSMERKLEMARYYGQLHQHSVQPRPPTSTEISVVYQDQVNTVRKHWWPNRLTNAIWHIDQTQERQPPGITFFCCMQHDAPSGGDTLVGSLVEAYNRLSPKMKEFVCGLKAVHSSAVMAAKAARVGGASRRNEIESLHPLVTVHPATGSKSLYINPERMTYIEGLRNEESDNMLKFLSDHVKLGADFHARYKWSEGDVCVWDQRVIIHSAVLDNMTHRRHFIRITALSSVPIQATYDPKDEENDEEE
ncbi:alpha-ketoglutarate-dependent taurine dioxygenase [Cryptococcus neoformans c8]|nr:alpha-ketoglutarate-dependent taurine dioxygenase [Cryptococcus neoformans var. grubii AD1-83a]OXG61883.1 alpha-ketoglutarate-dependent taurine dioxygenase [Cryptococcus neoformans var. grubii MW-RSA1955]OXG65123.1 alpha-ketoglutarate-dependent taurine dioxygenase [Cryptococcus neoformans var. grubii c8]OXG66753.1 alpha-ketoglutarate-dependent taurine dioxygenase [Cryptococcus neoformans var. grubii CHC193]OXH13067.1 alpha-ketoglutarate-dependent taurine dioxygenase [Cryptococcus neoformans 